MRRSQMRRGGLDRRGEWQRAFHLQVALDTPCRRRGEQRVEIFAAKAEVRDLAVRRRDDAFDPPGLVAHLHAHARRDVEPASRSTAHPVRAAVVGVVGRRAGGSTAACRPASRPAGPVAVDPVRPGVGHIQQRLVGRKGDAVGDISNRCRRPSFLRLAG